MCPASVYEPVNENVLIRASAGAGKTYQLTNRYLKLLLTGEPPESILAMTFTKKAAGEIFDRVFQRLAQAALSDEECRKLSAALFGDENRLNPAEILAHLKRLIQQFDSVEISTIDSYINQTAAQIPAELGLPFDWRIVEEPDNDRNRSRAIRLVLSPKNHTEMMGLISQLYPGESRRNLCGNLAQTVSDLTQAYREAPDKDRWPALKRRKEITAIDEFNQRIDELCAAHKPLKKNSNDINGNFQKGYLPLEIFLNNAKETAAGGTHPAKIQWMEFFNNGIIKKILQGSNVYNRTTIPDDFMAAAQELIEMAKSYIINGLITQTQAVFDLIQRISEAFDEIKLSERGFRYDDITSRLADYARQTARQTARQAGQEADQQASEKNRVFDAEENPVRHLLLDEFQDTSIDQWEILRPLAESVCPVKNEQQEVPCLISPADTVETIDVEGVTATAVPASYREPYRIPHHEPYPDRSFLCVGDTKQAIYAWRGGVAEIFDEVENHFAVNKQPLPDNRRSSPTVLETVRIIFDGMKTAPCGWLNLEDDADPKGHRNRLLVQAVRQWVQEEFTAPAAAGNNQNLCGYCALEEAPPKNADADSSFAANGENADAGNEEKEIPLTETAHYAVERIAELYPKTQGTIGVLVRSNKYIYPIVAELAKRNIEASQEGGVPLTVSSAVKILLALLTAADHPGDGGAFYAAAYHPLLAASILGGPVQQEKPDLSQAPLFSRRIRKKIAEKGFVPFIRKLVETLSADGNDRDRKMLTETLKLAVSFHLSGGGRLDEFCSLVESKKVELASASKVRVMTIHKAKGLEFDTVILPDLVMEQSRPDSFMVGRAENRRTSPIRTVEPYLSKELQPILDAEGRKMYDAQTVEQMKENMNLLYVALTRAVRRLILIISPGSDLRGKKSDGFSMEKLLREVLTQDRETEDNGEKSSGNEPAENGLHGRILWQLGEDTVSGGQNEPAAEDDTEQLTLANSEALSETNSEVFSAVNPAEDHSGEPYTERPLSAKEFCRTWSSLKRYEPGTVLHRAFSLVGWTEEPLPDRKTVEDILRAEIPDPAKAAPYADEFFRLLAFPEAMKILSRTSYKNGAAPIPFDEELQLELSRERPFWSRTKQGNLQLSIMDRLVLFKRNGRVVGADIIDFKSDQMPDAAEADSVSDAVWIEKYGRQLEGCRRIITDGFSLPRSAVSIRLYLIRFGRTVDLSSIDDVSES